MSARITSEARGASETTKRRWLRRHPWLSGTGLFLAAVVAFVLVYFDPQALFINHTVDEPKPVTAAVSLVPATASASAAALQAPQPTQPTPVAPTTVSSGLFRSLEHGTTGTALVLRLADGSLVVRLENLDTSNGPDLHVTLSPVPSTAGDRDFGDYLDLGSLKGNRGNQNYAVPAATDLTRFHSVVIWCKRFSVGFGVAPIA